MNSIFVPIIGAFEGGGGDAFGYNIARKLAIRALTEVGVIVIEDPKLDLDNSIVLFYCSPHFFKPITGKQNFLFTMWEAENLPWEIYDMCRKASTIIVPSKYSKEVLKRAGYSKTIEVCNQCIDTKFYSYKEKMKKEKFRVLWLGAPNIRKGYDLVPKAFYGSFLNNKDTELYLKTSLFEKEGAYTYNEHLRTHFDNRNVSREELRDLYYSADVLLYPSRGEGAGLIPMEAMSCGTPVIAPRYSGMADYIFKSVSYPVGYDLIEVDYGIKTKIAEARMPELIKQLSYCYEHLEDLQLKGYRASKFINESFSVARMGERLRNILFKEN